MNYRFVSILVFWLLSAVSYAAETKGRLVTAVTQQGETIDLYSGSYALLIGVSDYTGGWPDLQHIPAELKQVETMLREQGFEVVTHLNPSNKELKSAYEVFLNEHGFEPNNRLLFFFSGHGYSRKHAYPISSQDGGS